MTSPGRDPVQLDPALVLAAVERCGELGRALVRAASFEVLAEHYATQVAELRDTSSGSPDAPPGEKGATTP